jgi:OmcA/MtrC family decaheme c-type cytochrome
VPQEQATYEAGTTGQLVDNGDGTYSYTFLTAINNVAAVPYDATLSHRVGLEVRNYAPANNPTYTWQPSTGGTSGIFSREIVNNTACNACHDRLEFHGGSRVDLKYCATCHNPNTTDADSTHTVDLKVMIHKIHMGADLPSVVAGGDYIIYGRSPADYSNVHFPQDQRNCLTCHREGDATVPEAVNYRAVPTVEACGSCHDDINFSTGVGHSPATNADCITCHGPDSTVGNGSLRVDRVHTIPTAAAAEKFQYSILSATNTGPGQTPIFTIRVTDPTNNNAPYNIQDPTGPFQVGNSSLRVDVGWSTIDFNNIGSGSASAPTSGTPNQPFSIDFKTGATANPDGSFTKAASRALPAMLTGSGAGHLEGRPNVDADNNGTLDALGIAAAGLNFAVTDASPVARRQVANIAKCNDCHKTLSLHGGNRTDNTELCANCHNPNATDVNRHAGTGACAPGTPHHPIDLKNMIHAIHASGSIGGPISICGYNNTQYDFAVHYPGQLNNCEGCHHPDTYFPVDPAVVQGTSTSSGADRQLLADDVVTSPNSSVCATCHNNSTARTHMTQNGGDFNATKTETGALVSNATETCSLCHGPGRSADVKVMHGVGRFQSP